MISTDAPVSTKTLASTEFIVTLMLVLGCFPLTA